MKKIIRGIFVDLFCGGKNSGFESFSFCCHSLSWVHWVWKAEVISFSEKSSIFLYVTFSKKMTTMTMTTTLMKKNDKTDNEKSSTFLAFVRPSTFIAISLVIFGACLDGGKMSQSEQILFLTFSFHFPRLAFPPRHCPT